MDPNQSRRPRVSPIVHSRKALAAILVAAALLLTLDVNGIFPVWGQVGPAPPPGAGTPPERRDPFRPLIQKKAPPRSKEEVAWARLKLVGILWDHGGQLRALVETQDGLGYILKERDSIMGGQVVEITSEGVKFAIREGQSQPRIVSLPLYPKE